jgi:uncharacterized integral membrane protein
MQRFLTALVLIPLGLIFIVFAVANRHLVTLSLDPLNASDPTDGITLPLFAVIIGFSILGVIAGGAATWMRQRRWRRAARRHEADAIEARAQLADLRARIATPATAEPQSRPRLLSRASGTRTSERDKYGATL